MIDLIFPPLCLSCSIECTTKYLCPACWETLALPDPAARCRHCFAELALKTDLCNPCKSNPYKPLISAHVFDAFSPARLLPQDTPKALSAYLYLLFTSLDWPTPTHLIPMPDPASLTLAQYLSTLLQCPLSRALTPSHLYRPSSLPPSQNLLLLNAHNPLPPLQTASLSLSESEPKNLYCLSLHEPQNS